MYSTATLTSELLIEFSTNSHQIWRIATSKCTLQVHQLTLHMVHSENEEQHQHARDRSESNNLELRRDVSQ